MIEDTTFSGVDHTDTETQRHGDQGVRPLGPLGLRVFVVKTIFQLRTI